VYSSVRRCTSAGRAGAEVSITSAPSAAVVEGPLMSIVLGDALARAEYSSSMPTGTRQMHIPPVN